MKTIIRYHFILIALAMLLDFTVTPAMATGKKPSSGDDKRVQDYKRRIEDVNRRIEAAGKTLGQSTIDYKAQAERKQMELRALLEQYREREASTKKTIGELRRQEDELYATLRKYQSELKEKQEAEAKRAADAKRAALAKQVAEANRKREEAKKKAAEDARRKAHPKSSQDSKAREEAKKKAEYARRAHLKRFDVNRDGKVTKEETKKILAAEAKRREEAKKKATANTRSKADPKTRTYKVDLDRLKANYERAQKNHDTSSRLLENAKRAYEEARRNH